MKDPQSQNRVRFCSEYRYKFLFSTMSYPLLLPVTCNITKTERNIDCSSETIKSINNTFRNLILFQDDEYEFMAVGYCDVEFFIMHKKFQLRVSRLMARPFHVVIICTMYVYISYYVIDIFTYPKLCINFFHANVQRFNLNEIADF